MAPWRPALLSLVDAAFRARHPLALLDTPAITFLMTRHIANGTASAWMGWFRHTEKFKAQLWPRARWSIRWESH